ncbi:neuronal acetylcholine receptor subunit alpha-7-like [Haliotis asinina]|uniref:neuronal acetylcholine receptor subunit alpha-7-like n=1 Tax=Haliotis asinina TaxID=109174 RepID=UPI003531B37F
MSAMHRIVFFLFLCHLSLGSVSYKEKDFLANLTWNYDPKIRPVLDGSNTTVSISMGLYSLLSLDEKQEVLSFKAWISMLWKDQLLVWNMTNDIPDVVTLPLADVWSPNVLNVDSVTNQKYLKDETDTVLVYHDGTVSYTYIGRFDTRCKVNIQQFPFDRQTCHFHLNTFYAAASKEYMNVDDSKVILEAYKGNGEFHLRNISMTGQKLTLLNTSYDWIEVTFVLQRRVTFYILNNILPVVFLSFLNVFVFLLPKESGEKVSFCVSILLSYAMFMTLISSYLPANSDHVCFFSVYVSLLVFISTLACLVTVFMQLFHTNLQNGKVRPRWLPNACGSGSKVGRIKLQTEQTSPNKSEVKDKPNKKSEIKDAIITKCNRVAFGTFFTLTLLINLIFFISVSL